MQHEAAGLLAGLRSRTGAMVDDLGELVAAESPSGDLAALRACTGLLAELGTRVLGARPERGEAGGAPYLRWQIGAPSGPLVLGHLDTVWPLGTTERWPFSVDGDVATGPGVFDMKAGLVVALHALAAIGASAPGVTLLVTSDEELGSPGSRALVEAAAAQASHALVLEPSAPGGRLKIARKGVGLYDLHVTGRAAHAGLAPEDGRNATIAAAHAVLEAAALGHPEAGTTVTPTVMRSGTAANVVPESADVHIDVRAWGADELQRVDRALRTVGASPVFAGTTVAVTGGINRLPLQAQQSEALHGVAERVAAGLGLPPLGGDAVGGGSDGNFTAGVGTPTLDGLGPEGGGAHAEGEWCRVSSLPERAALVAALVEALASPTISRA